MMNTIPLAVVIPTHNRLELFKRTLESVLACLRPEFNEVRLIVVENGGRFGVKEYLQNTKSWLIPEYLFVEEGNKSQALNAVLDSLENELIVFLDDDVKVVPDLLERYAIAANSNPSQCIFGGPIVADYVEQPPDWLLDYLPVSAKGWEPEEYQPIHPGGLWFMGFNWAAFTADIRRAGGFNPEVGPGAKSGATGQETAMQRALVDLGVVPVYVPEARVWHYVPESRCSPEWALERAFRNGVTSGLAAVEPTSRMLLNGVPLWMMRKRLELAWQVFIASITKSEQEVFGVNFKLHEFRGQMAGVRKKRSKNNEPV